MAGKNIPPPVSLRDASRLRRPVCSRRPVLRERRAVLRKSGKDVVCPPSTVLLEELSNPAIRLLILDFLWERGGDMILQTGCVLS